MNTHRHASRLIGSFKRRQDQARAAGTQDDWCDRHMQPVETSSSKKARQGISAAFDEDAAHAAAGERGDDRRGCDVSVGGGQSENFDAGGWRTAPTLRSDQQAADAVVGEQPGFGAEARLRRWRNGGRVPRT